MSWKAAYSAIAANWAGFIRLEHFAGGFATRGGGTGGVKTDEAGGRNRGNP